MNGLGDVAVVGLGVTDMTHRVYGSGRDFAAEALALALADAGLDKSDLDGLLVHGNQTADSSPELANALGLRELRLFSVMYAAGAGAGGMLQYAAMAIGAGLVDTVALVFSDAPLRPRAKASSTQYGGAPSRTPEGWDYLPFVHGDFGVAVSGYALAAQRHMDLYGTTSEQLGAIAVAQRAWAQLNPAAQMRKPMTLSDHQSSRLVVEPLHLFDCCLVSNGAVALVLTSGARARDLPQPPVYLRSVVQSHPGDDGTGDRDGMLVTGASRAGPAALRAADLELSDITLLQLYDCFTYTVLVTLEDLGFCGKGEGGAFVADGKLGPGGSLPTNTGGGQLSSFYMWTFTQLSEAVIQGRGQAGERQVARNDHILVSANGGILRNHASIVMSPHRGART
ncbi:thiolase [Pseudonocardia ailaonensis]|uniref:Thiolase n=1 Tax=Pseudonocardia ailaonensis TaxID=367279 RepID=A0ABN2NI20_9PSEU